MPTPRTLVVANRLPIRKNTDGRWIASSGGLVSAMEPILTRTGGAWIGWSGDATASPSHIDHDGFDLQIVELSEEEVAGFYGGFSNSTLWPLYHDAVRPPEFHRRWWRSYCDVNQRFADATIEQCGRNDRVWVHDYQLHLVPSMIRTKARHARIGFFLHIPFPPSELFAQLPWRRQILDGMLGADVVGFQTPQSGENFIASAERFAKARRLGSQLEYLGRTIDVSSFPISIDAERTRVRSLTPTVRETVLKLKSDIGHRKIILGIDRLDYTKGIDIRLRAFEELLSRGRFSVDDCVFIQVAVPSRGHVEDYQLLRERVEQLTGRINGRFGEPGQAAVHYMHRSLSSDELAAYYRAADVMVVTPLRDGMNLVAKEYVMSQAESSGVLVLSEFAGAAHELHVGALLVNPHDVDGLATAIEEALEMVPDEAIARLIRMQQVIAEHDVYAWADSFMEAMDR